MKNTYETPEIVSVGNIGNVVLGTKPVGATDAEGSYPVLSTLDVD